MMGRMTRKKAAEVAEQLHVDEDDLELPVDNAPAKTKGVTPEPGDRAPLGELAPNSGDSNTQSDDGGAELKKSVRGKKGGKKGGAKGKKNAFAASTASQPELANENDGEEVLPDENDSAPSPASEKAAEDLMNDIPKLSIHDTKKAPSPPSAAVKLTRSQLRKQGELNTEPKSLVDGIGQTPEEQETMKEESLRDAIPAIETGEIENAANTTDAPPSPLPTAVPKVVSHLRADTPAKRSTSNKENMEPDTAESPSTSQDDVLEGAAIAAATPPAQSTARPEDHIAALDELDDAVETVSKDIPEVQTSPEKPKGSSESKGSPKKKAAPVVRTTKAASARISLAHNPKDAASSKGPSLGRPRPSTTLGRASSVRESSINKSSSTSKRVVSTSSTKDNTPGTDEVAEKKEVVIPHSKPRPFSMSFPTPPPPPKSTKAPTQSTFQLPGEAVAAKLKAAREARAQKEAAEEEKKKKAFKARPVPASLSKAPSVRQTNASRSRESAMNGKDFRASTSAAGAVAHKSSATFRPNASTSAVSKSRTVSKEAAKPTTSTAKARASTAMANIGKPRTSLSTSTSTGLAASTTGGPSNGAKSANKGKEVFNRVAAAKAAADKEKHEREAAAKKARQDAAERSRQLSREFAEKQRLKKAAAAAKKQDAGKANDDAQPADAAPAVEG